MAIDLSVELIQATVQVEQPLGDGTRSVGTGFLVSDPTPDGKPRTVLVTANHVFAKMPGPIATIGFRVRNADGSWRYDPEPLRIRDGNRELWTRNPNRDVAVIAIAAPPEFAKAAIPEDWLATDQTFDKYAVGPGDELLALGFPEGLSANDAGFPILRSGRVASFPLEPSSAFPTFLLDFNVFPGNSGGPVYMADASRRRPGAAGDSAQFIAGILTRQVELNNQNLSIGIVVHARFIREALNLLDAPAPTPSAPSPAPPVGAAVAQTAVIPGLMSAENAAIAR
ncbi:MAG: trypsin-like peptidase domain-containing protein [Caulobacteraceae bacterium]|nr:trypsin-like peptidase domain-containing protein [Caulobacteraceae bacterium]